MFEYVHRKSMLEEKQRYPSSKMCSNKRTICVYKIIATVAKSLLQNKKTKSIQTSTKRVTSFPSTKMSIKHDIAKIKIRHDIAKLEIKIHVGYNIAKL